MTTERLAVDSVTADEIVDTAEPRYVGLATRALGFLIDAALVDGVAVIVGLGAALIFSVFHLPKDLKAVWVSIGAAAYILWFFGYFVSFWSGTGQTPGARVMQIRVVTANGSRVKPSRAVVRCVGVVLASLPLFLGFLPILFDSRRRGVQDYLAHTLVVEAPQLSLAEVRRAKKRASYEATRQPASTV